MDLVWVENVILSATLLTIILLIASAIFSVALFEGALSASVGDCLAWESFWLYLPLHASWLHVMLWLLT